MRRSVLRTQSAEDILIKDLGIRANEDHRHGWRSMEIDDLPNSVTSFRKAITATLELRGCLSKRPSWSLHMTN